MNSFKTELFKVTFEEPTGQDHPCVTITHLKSEEYVECFTFAQLAADVDDKLQTDQIDAEEAIRIIRKSAAFFIMGLYV